MKPESPMLAVYTVLVSRFSMRTHAVELPVNVEATRGKGKAEISLVSCNRAAQIFADALANWIE